MSTNPSYDFGHAALCLGHMSATSTRLKLNGVTLGPRLKAQLLQPFVSRDYPLHYVHPESKILVKSRHFRVTCGIVAMLINLAVGASPSRLATYKTPLGRSKQRRPKVLALRSHTGQDPTDAANLR